MTYQTCPASLSTLRVSVPPAVKLAPASANLDDFVACYFGGTSLRSSGDLQKQVPPPNRYDRKEAERFKSFTYEELSSR